jgi:hypothetical protein
MQDDAPTSVFAPAEPAESLVVEEEVKMIVEEKPFQDAFPPVLAPAHSVESLVVEEAVMSVEKNLPADPAGSLVVEEKVTMSVEEKPAQHASPPAIAPAPADPSESLVVEVVVMSAEQKAAHPTIPEQVEVQHPAETALFSCDEVLTMDIDPIVTAESQDEASAGLVPKLEVMDASDIVSATSPSASTAAAGGSSASSAPRKRGSSALSSDPASRKSKSSTTVSSGTAVTSPTQEVKARSASKPLVVRLPRRPRDPQWAFSHVLAMDGSVVEDGRRCLFCHLPEDSTGELLGRLLPVDAGQYAHLQCCLWSSEVFEGNVGLLDKVPNARTRAATTRCPHCNLLNASVNCCFKRCMRSYHLPCLLAAGGYVRLAQQHDWWLFSFLVRVSL